MSVKINMEMPKSCLDCVFYINGDSGFMLYGVKIGGKCKMLPIEDMDGEVINYQNICKNGAQVQELLKGRDKRCPLQEVKCTDSISSDDYLKFYRRAKKEMEED